MDHWMENYCEDENNLFLKKKYVASLYGAICEFNFQYMNEAIYRLLY